MLYKHFGNLKVKSDFKISMQEAVDFASVIWLMIKLDDH